MLNAFFSATAPCSSEEDALFSTLTLPGVHRYTECYSDDNDYDEEETLATEVLEEELTQSSDAAVGDWLPKKESGQTKLFLIAVQTWSTMSVYLFVLLPAFSRWSVLFIHLPSVFIYSLHKEEGT